MTSEILYEKPELLIAFVLLALMSLAGELGYRLGRRENQSPKKLNQTHSITILAAIVGLLSLMIGFTFSMALSRFEYRKQMVVQESNAIGTSALRSQFLPSSYKAEVSELYRRYVEIRLESVFHTAQSSPARQQLDAETRQLQARLWEITSEAARDDQQSIPLGLFTHSVNQLIDIRAQRDVAIANHVPESVLLMLMFFSILIAGILGYTNGLLGARSLALITVYNIIVVLAILLIIDLDRPQQGLARVNQMSMIQLQDILNSIKH